MKADNYTFTIEASNIYFRGGFVLLEQILDYCETNKISVRLYLGYQEVLSNVWAKQYQYIDTVKTNGIQTLLRYSKSRSNVLFFCNLPPFVRCENSVLYAHNILFFESPIPSKGQSVLFNLKKFFYFYWIKLFARNVKTIACQTEAVRSSLKDNLNVVAELYPFYRQSQVLNLPIIYDFCYVGSSADHKNNFRLLEAVDILSFKREFCIVLTLEKKDLLDKILEINNKHNRTVIINKGFVPYENVCEIYASTRALIFTSLAETIALPLIEGLQYGLKVLSSDLHFSYQVVENPIVFNPESVDEIVKVMENFLEGKYDHIEQRNKIPNKLPELIDKLIS